MLYIVLDGKPLNFPELCIWNGCIISISDNLNFDVASREIFKIYKKTFCTKLSYTEWLKGGKRQEGLSFKGLSISPKKKSDKQNISEILAFPLQLVLHERLVSACLLKLWHDPSTLSPSETLTKLWEYSDAALGVTCKTTAEDENFCSYKLHHCSSSSTKKRRLHDNYFKHQVSESR